MNGNSTRNTTHQSFRVSGIPHAAAGVVRFSEIVTATSATNHSGAPINRSASGMTASIRDAGTGTYEVMIIAGPGHASDERAEVMVTATALD